MCEWSFDATFCCGSDFVPEGNQTLDLSIGLQPTLYLWATTTVVLTSTCWFEGCWNWVWSEPEHVLGGKDLIMLSETGRCGLNAFTGILDQPTLHLWWDVFGMKCATLILKHSCDFVLNFPRKWMRFIDSRAKRFLQTSIFESLHLLAIIARSFPLKTCSGSLQTQFQQPSNQQVLVHTTVVVAQR